RRARGLQRSRDGSARRGGHPAPRGAPGAQGGGLRGGTGRVQEDARRRARALDRRVLRPAALRLLQGAGAEALMHALLLLVTLAPQAAAPVSGAVPAPEPKPASPVSVTATASKSEITVGEPFTIELKATGPSGTTYTFASEASADTLELRTPAPP